MYALCAAGLGPVGYRGGLLPRNSDGGRGRVEKYRREIRAIAAERGIKYLYHFTPDANLLSILEHGLHSRQTLLEAGVKFLVPDAYRMDGRAEAVCLSIHGINMDMLAAKRRDYPDWAVLAFDASILWTHRCRFCWRNAASAEVARKKGFLGGPYGLELMFAEPSIGPNRLAQGLQPYEPTDPSAEVQVFDPVSPDLIRGVILEHEAHRTLLEPHVRKIGRAIELAVEPAFFP